MAKSEYKLNGDFYGIVNAITNSITSSSSTASMEVQTDWQDGSAICAFRVFERYSATGGNRVSLAVTFFCNGGPVHISGITSGGSVAMFFKLNTLGEDAFLSKLDEAVVGLTKN
jgi:hypothetical protein